MYWAGNSGSADNKTELFNGTNWTETTDLPASFVQAGGGGTQTAGLSYAGWPSSNILKTYEWSGPGSAQTRTFTDS